MLTGRGEWSLDTGARIFDGKTEAEFMAQSIADVAKHYGGIADQKTLDWFNLIQCLAIVWGGRVFLIRSTPRPARAPGLQPAQGIRPGPPPSMHRTPEPVNNFDANANPAKANVGEIAGIGGVEFPDDHPLNPKTRMN